MKPSSFTEEHDCVLIETPIQRVHHLVSTPYDRMAFSCQLPHSPLTTLR